MELETVFDTFADATEAKLVQMAEDLRAMRAEMQSRADETRALIAEARSAIAEVQTRAAAPIPVGKDGQDGKDGRGLAAVQIRDGNLVIRYSDGAEQEAGPVVGKDGKDGIGKDGKDGENGRDGRGIASVQIRDGHLVVRFSDDSEQDVGHVVGQAGKDGKDGIGKDGKDGRDGERGTDGVASAVELDARFAAMEARAASLVEERFAALQVRTFADVYQGVFEPNREYSRGLLTTWGGSLWLSVTDTRSKPGESSDWKLVVKRGADGRK